MNFFPLPRTKIFTGCESAVRWRNSLRASGRKLVVTNGCFDLLHRGHAEYLLAARQLGNALLVLVNSDASVRALKGPTRPVNHEYDRAYLLASLACVDAVLVFNGARCAAELDRLAPDIYAKGGDYTLDTLDASERAVLLKHGAEVRFLPLATGYSTTQTLRRAGKIDRRKS